ncbi:MAG: hypothetical protein KDD44_02290, partial [Bdellovibrionales bacterium]|nr:hypothetical protein [Bdellovibrionales bacterium]
TEFDRISREAVPQIKRWILKEGTRFQERVRSYLAQFDADTNPDIPPHQHADARVVVGTFSFSEMSEERA